MAITRLPPYYKMKISNQNQEISSEFNLYNDRLSQTLRQIVESFNNGINLPRKTTAEISDLEPNAEIGATWFNTDLAKLQVKTADGIIETITSA